MLKKNESPAFPLGLASGGNPLTPPLSDGSSYSTTPSPNDTNAVQPLIRGMPAAVPHMEGAALHSSSVMLSPYSDHQNGNGCSPPQMIGNGMYPCEVELFSDSFGL